LNSSFGLCSFSLPLAARSCFLKGFLLEIWILGQRHVLPSRAFHPVNGSTGFLHNSQSSGRRQGFSLRSAGAAPCCRRVPVRFGHGAVATLPAQGPARDSGCRERGRPAVPETEISVSVPTGSLPQTPSSW